MAHILITSTNSPAKLRAKYKAEGMSNEEARAEFTYLQDVFLDGSFTNLASHSGTFTVTNVTDEDGNFYDEVNFIIEARYVRDGDTYLAGSGFAMNVSKFIRDALKAIA